RCQTGGRPGERNLRRVDLSERRLWVFIATSWFRPLRRPVESAQYLSIRYTDRLAEAGIEPSVGSVGDRYDNALAETINGLFRAEVIHRRGPWRSVEAVEHATLEWVDWFNHRRLLEPIGSIPPAQAEANFYAAMDTPVMAASLRPTGLRETRCGSITRWTPPLTAPIAELALQAAADGPFGW
ncbi:integrase core domain-containing protein, partial [Paracoccus sp. S-4012]|uniref:integrase core domain-containing protein n=1 Tax=Paracoccus sp. S-4012 TaxID=2665648 RepID=UPI001E453C38